MSRDLGAVTAGGTRGRSGPVRWGTGCASPARPVPGRGKVTTGPGAPRPKAGRVRCSPRCGHLHQGYSAQQAVRLLVSRCATWCTCLAHPLSACDAGDRLRPARVELATPRWSANSSTSSLVDRCCPASCAWRSSGEVRSSDRGQVAAGHQCIPARPWRPAGGQQVGRGIGDPPGILRQPGPARYRHGGFGYRARAERFDAPAAADQEKPLPAGFGIACRPEYVRHRVGRRPVAMGRSTSSVSCSSRLHPKDHPGA